MAKKNEGAKKSAPETKAPPKAPSKTVSRKVEQNELLQLQKEGRLVGYDPATRIGVVKESGDATKWPAGEANVA
tara:strand:- start:263 stop:484 length:222 start_codon:yes stop_codon:yes gene_type:complete